MSAPDSIFQDGGDDAVLAEVPECRCGRVLKISEYKHGECESCHSRLRLPCVESVSPRIMRRYRRPM